MDIEIKNRPKLEKYLFLYLLITVFIYAFGPYQWKTQRPFLTYTLLFSYMFAFYFGGTYARSYSKPVKATQKSGIYYLFLKYYNVIVILSIVLSFFSLQRLIQRYGLSGFTDLYDRLTGDFRSLYFAIDTAETGAEMYGGVLFSAVSALTSPLMLLVTPFTIVAFKDLNSLKRVLGIVAVTLRLLVSISAGSNYGIFLAVIPIFVALYVASTRKAVYRKKKNRSRQTVLMVLAVIVILYLFYIVMDNRMKGEVSFVQIGDNGVDKNNVFLKVLPNGLKKLLMWAEFYVCQGYYGFSLATTVKWTPLFGTGFSRWLCLEIDPFVSVYKNSYVCQIDMYYNWDASANWHTAYTWLANDVSLLGVIVLMWFVGYILSKSFDSSCETLNPFSLGLLMLLVQMVLFLPCNNVVFADSKTFISFFVYLLGYYFTKEKNIPEKAAV